MHSNYNSSSSNNNNSHKISNLSGNGLYHLMNGMKLLNPKWTGMPTVTNSNVSPPPRHSSFYKSTIFQNAASAASESAQYCNMILRSPPQQEREEYSSNRVHHSSKRVYHYEPQQQISNSREVAYNDYSLLPIVHQQPVINRVTSRNNGNDVDYYHRQQRKQTLPNEHQQLPSPDSTSKRFSADQHYRHYYSYYYNSETQQQAVHTGRKLPNTFMATSKNKHCMKNGNNSFPTDDEPVLTAPKHTTSKKYHKEHKEHKESVGAVQQHVLKEKMLNNNVVGSCAYDNGDWMANINSDGDLMNITNDFLDVQDLDTYDKKLHYTDAKDARLCSLPRSKRKLRIRSDSEAIALSPEKSSHKNTLDFVPSNKAEDDVCKPGQAHQTRLKGGANIKRHSPPVHRVLLYDSQSPRLTRLSPSNLGSRDKRRGRSKSPLINRNKHLYNHHVAENNQKEPVHCYVRVMKSLNQSQPHHIDKADKVQKTILPAKNCSRGADDANDNDDVSTDDDFDDLDNVSNFDDSERESTSDSEDGYRAHAYKLTHSLDRVSTCQSILSSETSMESLVNPTSVLVPSLFPNVPPYLAFSSNTSKGPKVPPELYRVLKWRVTNVMPKVVRCVLANSGMRLLKKTNDWMGIWGKHMKSPCFKTIRPYQKINHLPGSFKIGRKDACWKNLQKQINRHGNKDFGFMPKTYIIPHDLNMLRKHWPKYAQRNVKWIIKPPASARGTGIRVVDRWAQIPKRRPLIVQKYIERPLLINGSKFDLRLYVLVTSINPLRVFMYHNGLARFASVKYSDRSDTLNDRCMHLTNYSINKFSSNYSKNEDVNACHGHKWTIKSLWNYLANRGVRTDYLWEALRSLVLRTILAGEHSINNMIRLNMESKYSCFELFGFDVLLDADLIPWLLEVNISPSLHSELPLDAHVKAPLVQGVLNTALYNVPPKLSVEMQKEIAQDLSFPPGPLCYDKRIYINYLSSAEKIKHTTFTRKTMEDRDNYITAILDNLTPDDIRCLIVAEDEFARCAPLERIFPTNQTYKYLKYTESQRYYNRLLDAWENRYANNRARGITLLRSYCEEKYHLEVPPSPAKKDSSVDSKSSNDFGSEHSSNDVI